MNGAPEERPKYVIVVEALPAPAPPERRLARLLKALLRGYGFRCLEVREAEASRSRAATPTPEGGCVYGHDDLAPVVEAGDGTARGRPGK